MRNSIKWVLFGSSYSPLFLLLIIKDWNSNTFSALGPFRHSWLPQSLHEFFYILANAFYTPVFSYTVLAVSVAAIAVLFFVIQHSLQQNGSVYHPAKITSKSGESINYIVTYIIPFLSFKISDWGDFLSLVILLAVMASLYVNSNLIYTNPILSFMGYRSFEVETHERTVFMILTKSTLVNRDDEIHLVQLTDNVYLHLA